jgi:hypothetical protein
MSDQITASFSELLKQAGMTAADYLSDAVRHIDKTFGDGYAKANPLLVAEFMRVAGNDFNTASAVKVMSAALRELAFNVERIAENMVE